MYIHTLLESEQSINDGEKVNSLGHITAKYKIVHAHINHKLLYAQSINRQTSILDKEMRRFVDKVNITPKS